LDSFSSRPHLNSVPLGLPVLAAIGLKDRSSATYEQVMAKVAELFRLAHAASAS
jgi:hypothetical protein